MKIYNYENRRFIIMRIEDVVDTLDRMLSKEAKKAGIRLILHKQILPSSFGAYKIYMYRLFYVDTYHRWRYPLIEVQSTDRSVTDKEKEIALSKIENVFLRGIFELIQDTPKWDSIVRGEYSDGNYENI